MTDTTEQFGHQINISAIQARGVPTLSSVFNEFDSHGVLLGLPRLRGEKNAEYKKRLLDVYTHRASSTYTGLINGITRELGLEFYKPIVLSKDPSLPGSQVPVIEFVENKVKIWSNGRQGDPDIEINRSSVDSKGYWVGDLVTKINESGLFTAVLSSGAELFSRSDCILNQSSSKLVNSEALKSSQQQVLNNKKLEPGSLTFSDRFTFAKEVQTKVEVTKQGYYFVDYENGVINSYSVPDTGSRVRYNYNLETFEPVASPVIIRNTLSEDFQEQMFIQTQSPTGETNSGIPTELGANIINELMSVFPMYWGD